MKTKGFTLIELLVVIAVIGILMTLVPPGVRKARENAKKGQAKIEMQTIETAIQSFFSEYGKLPVDDDVQGLEDVLPTVTDYETDAEASRLILSRLVDEQHEDNPRGILFLEPQYDPDIGTNAVNGAFLDPWGFQYILAIDSDYDNSIVITGDQVKKRTAVGCVGLYELKDDQDIEDILWNWK